MSVVSKATTMVTQEDLANQLAGIVAPRHPDLRQEQLEGLACFLRELERWNRVHNLTALRNAEEMIERHVLESLAVRELIEGTRVADAGTGAGLPGLPIAIANPNCDVTLIDSVSKKAAFVQHVVGVLGLNNVRIQVCRLEDYRPERGFDTVVARALARLDELTHLVGHLLAADGIIVALKGPQWQEEIPNLPKDYEIRNVRSLEIPGRDSRAIVIQRRA